VADWEYPGLGFDPLPGNPQLIQDLQLDARTFGQRMTTQATELNRLASRGDWQGEAAAVFSQHLKTLPRDLERCGEAFTGLADALVTYAGIFDVAKRTTVADLERRALEARQNTQARELAFHTPVISAPGDCPPPPPDRKPLDDAHDQLGAILREAHDYTDNFNDMAEVQHLEHIIRQTLTQYAPDQPRWNIIKHWAGDVFKATPVGAALNAAHELINQYGEFFNSLAGFLSELSGVLGIIALPAMFFPPLGEALGVAILGLTAASAGMKTSLYVGEARDANGKLLVKGGDLIHSYIDVGLSAAAVGGVAGVYRARILKEGGATTFTDQVVHQFSGAAMKKAWHAPETAIAKGIAEAGRKGAAKAILKAGVEDFSSDLKVVDHVSVKNLALGGVVVGGAAPLLNAENPLQDRNIFGWQSIRKFPKESIELKHETRNLLSHEPETPDLQLKVQPTLGNPGTPATTIGPERSGPLPVMGYEKEL
jgi:hypothetical protein